MPQERNAEKSLRRKNHLCTTVKTTITRIAGAAVTAETIAGANNKILVVAEAVRKPIAGAAGSRIAGADAVAVDLADAKDLAVATRIAVYAAVSVGSSKTLTKKKGADISAPIHSLFLLLFVCAKGFFYAFSVV